ncbi:hypothetical protein BB561_004283 [Smittium simulii]|uniref:Chromatin modification-related protein EAF7 n=1 Tax=Smittium simulii TaxID=133385 RepID=A0A2T9YH54_9FUNG|nr:hypothetical protein BB561_004283 [Smittium simulii]
MCNIYQRFSQRAFDCEYSTADLWERIKDWYNLETLEDLEVVSDSEDSEIENEEDTKDQDKYLFNQKLVYTLKKPQELDFWKKMNEFFLPWDEYGTMILERAGEGVDDDNESPYIDNFSQDLSSKHSTPEPIEDVQEEIKKPKIGETILKKKGKSTIAPSTIVPPSTPTVAATPSHKRKKPTRQQNTSRKSKRR